MRAVGEGTMESMKTVERPWVITIALTGPNRRGRDEGDDEARAEADEAVDPGELHQGLEGAELRPRGPRPEHLLVVPQEDPGRDRRDPGREGGDPHEAEGG